MGFIIDNTNTFEVYLTDLGRQAFLENGLANAIAYFSISDEDSNYGVFTPDPTEVIQYTGTSLSTYVPGNVVVSGDTFFRFKIGSGSRTAPPSTWWDKLIVFNPTVLTPQPIPTINQQNSLGTSLGDGTPGYYNDVFTQTALRGDIINGQTYSRLLKTVNKGTLGSYVFFQPDPTLTGYTSTITYIIR